MLFCIPYKPARLSYRQGILILSLAHKIFNRRLNLFYFPVVHINFHSPFLPKTSKTSLNEDVILFNIFILNDFDFFVYQEGYA